MEIPYCFQVLKQNMKFNGLSSHGSTIFTAVLGIFQLQWRPSRLGPSQHAVWWGQQTGVGCGVSVGKRYLLTSRQTSGPSELLQEVLVVALLYIPKWLKWLVPLVGIRSLYCFIFWRFYFWPSWQTVNLLPSSWISSSQARLKITKIQNCQNTLRLILVSTARTPGSSLASVAGSFN